MDSCRSVTASVAEMPKEDVKRFGLSYGNLQESLEVQDKLIETLNMQLSPLMKDVPPFDGAELIKGDNARDDRSEWVIKLDELRYRVNESNDKLRRIMELLEI